MEEKLKKYLKFSNGFIMMGVGIGVLMSLGGSGSGNT